MKESAKILTVIMVIIFGFAAIANKVKHLDERVQIVPGDMGVFKLVYTEKSTEDVKVSILNDEGNAIIKEEVDAQHGFINVYDLRERGSGKYIFRIEDSTHQFEQTVYYDQKNKIVLIKMGNTRKYKLVVEDNDVNLNIDIFNKDNELLLSDEIHKSGSINKTYDISKILESGEEITFKIKANLRFLIIATF